MKCSVTIVCSDLLAGGFELAGVHVAVAGSGEQAQEILLAMLGAERWGVAIIDRDIMMDLPPRLRQRLKDSSVPLFVGLPLAIPPENTADPTTVSDYIEAMIQDAIGKKIAVAI